MKSLILVLAFLVGSPAFAYGCYILKNDDKTPAGGWAGYVGEMAEMGKNAYALIPKGAEDGTPFLGGLRDGIVSTRENDKKIEFGRIDGNRLLSLTNGLIIATIDSEMTVTSGNHEFMGFARGDDCTPSSALAGVAIAYYIDPTHR